MGRDGAKEVAADAHSAAARTAAAAAARPTYYAGSTCLDHLGSWLRTDIDMAEVSNDCLSVLERATDEKAGALGGKGRRLEVVCEILCEIQLVGVAASSKLLVVDRSGSAE